MIVQSCSSCAHVRCTLYHDKLDFVMRYTTLTSALKCGRRGVDSWTCTKFKRKLVVYDDSILLKDDAILSVFNSTLSDCPNTSKNAAVIDIVTDTDVPIFLEVPIISKHRLFGNISIPSNVPSTGLIMFSKIFFLGVLRRLEIDL